MSSSRHFYVTTAIPYVNGDPHLGHALEFVQADVLARHRRTRGDAVRFLSGTDDNALKNVDAAVAAGLPVASFVQQKAERFAALAATLDLSHDDFIRTSTDPRHRVGVERLWQRCAEAGDLYQRDYEGLYCAGCEAFLAPEDLPEGRCPEHRRPLEHVVERNWFFRLSRHQEALLDLVAGGALRIEPPHRRNEVRAFIESGVEDFSVSRPRRRAGGWGIPVPGDPGQVVYVWFDALGNYITALDYATDGELYRRYWRENRHRVHIIGKDILRFHAVYWPAMLLSAGEPLPTNIYVHEFLTVDGQKMSKSLGNVVNPAALADEYGTDALRYWLLREMPRTEDGDFTLERLIRRYNDDLANDLGNLLNRTLSMIWRYRGGAVPAPVTRAADEGLTAVAGRIPEATAAALDEFDFRAALAATWELVTRANRYVEENAPWVLARREKNGDAAAARHLDTVLYNLAESLRLLAFHLSPYLPRAAGQMAQQLGISLEETCPYLEAVAWGGFTPGARVARPQPIFPRIE